MRMGFPCRSGVGLQRAQVQLYRVEASRPAGLSCPTYPRSRVCDGMVWEVETHPLTVVPRCLGGSAGDVPFRSCRGEGSQAATSWAVCPSGRKIGPGPDGPGAFYLEGGFPNRAWAAGRKRPATACRPERRRRRGTKGRAVPGGGSLRTTPTIPGESGVVPARFLPAFYGRNGPVLGPVEPPAGRPRPPLGFA